MGFLSWTEAAFCPAVPPGPAPSGDKSGARGRGVSGSDAVTLNTGGLTPPGRVSPVPSLPGVCLRQPRQVNQDAVAAWLTGWPSSRHPAPAPSFTQNLLQGFQQLPESLAPEKPEFPTPAETTPAFRFNFKRQEPKLKATGSAPQPRPHRLSSQSLT